MRLPFSLLLPFLVLALVCKAAPGASVSTTEVQYLSGTGAHDQVSWDFFCSAGNRSGTWGKIKVPSCWELEGYGTYNYGMAVRDKAPNHPSIAREQGRYRHSFSIPREWSGRVIRIVFDGVMTDAEVTINGKSAGPIHQGAFYRFRHDITKLVSFDKPNTLEVLVSKESSNNSVNEAERRGDYWNFGGIFRPVFLEALPVHHIEHLAVDAKADGSFLADLELSGPVGSGETVECLILDKTGKQLGATLSSKLEAQASDCKVALTGKFADVKTWTAETPALYQVVVNLRRGTELLHQVKDRIGFRTVEVRPGDGIYLNGSKLLLKGVNRHCFWPETGRTMSPELDMADVKLMKEMNMNTVRSSHYPPDKRFLEYCDEQGLYVLNELAGWHGIYDTEVGGKLLAEMMRRDVNHASVLFWDNGNEGGWNVELDTEFAKHDPQRRPVLHPLGVFGGLNTFHYRSYEETKHFLKQPEIFLPTEFLHGLYDGGHGAGLHDYWELMRKHPRCAGGLLWVYADEGVVRSDQNGRVDNAGNWGPDGIVGPHHEKEGSFYTIKEVWSPVHVAACGAVQKGFTGEFEVENRYDFVNLEDCSFEWSLARFPNAASKEEGHGVVACGSLRGPKAPARSSTRLKLPLPADWLESDALYLSAKGPSGETLWTWSWSWKSGYELARLPVGKSRVLPRDDSIYLCASTGAIDLRVDKESGDLDSVYVHGVPVRLNKGPRFVAARRADRSPEGLPIVGLPKGEDRKYIEIVDKHKLLSVTSRVDGEDVVIESVYDGILKRATWRIQPDATVRLDWEYAYEGVVDLMGVGFSCPEDRMKSLRWLGMGPCRSWQNRTHGTQLDLWKSNYNDLIPGESFGYPEFKGYFQGWKWAEFQTDEARILFVNATPGSYLGVYTPRDGQDALLYTFPQTGLTILDVIPPVRNKVNATELIGPQSQPFKASGLRKGSLLLRFDSAR